VGRYIEGEEVVLKRILARCSAPVWNGDFLATTGCRGRGWYRIGRSRCGAGK
jgi:hypothetical protein